MSEWEETEYCDRIGKHVTLKLCRRTVTGLGGQAGCGPDVECSNELECDEEDQFGCPAYKRMLGL